MDDGREKVNRSVRKSNPAQSLIVLEDVSYTHKGQEQPTLNSISLNVSKSTTCAIVGTSGSGKSTLLNILGLLDRPTLGRFYLAGNDMSESTRDQRSIFRNRHIGFVFQSFNLIKQLTAEENVSLPLIYRGLPNGLAKQKALSYLDKVGLQRYSDRLPADLSGGQRQRVAIARALIGEPSILLADEPTGNLDSSTANEIMDLLLQINKDYGVTVIVVTHDSLLASRLDKEIRVHDGEIVGNQ